MALFLALALPATFLGLRYQQNITGIVPYPYEFAPNVYQGLNVQAPILIVGDRMGKRLASFSSELSKRLSQNLSSAIKIESLAQEGEGLYRTLEKIRSLPKLPLIIIYLGGSQESYESRFYSDEIDTIAKNLKLAEDIRLKTLMMIAPKLSRLIYAPVKRKKLSAAITRDESDYGPSLIQKRNAIAFQLFEQELNELFSYAKDRNSYMIAISSPINLDAKVRSSCPGSFGPELTQSFNDLKKLVEGQDFKKAYEIGKDLVLMAPYNARALYIQGQVAKRLGKTQEALRLLEQAVAYDCENWRSNPVYNSILQKTAAKNDVVYFDFQKMLTDQWQENITFMDEIYPQNVHMERMMEALAGRLKKLLKL